MSWLGGKEKNIYPQHFHDLLHCHYCRDLLGPVTYFSLSFSVTQMISSQQMRNTSELHKFTGKRVKGKTRKVPSFSICLKNGSNTGGEGKRPETDAERCWGSAGYPRGMKHLNFPSSPRAPAAPHSPPGPRGDPFSVGRGGAVAAEMQHQQGD